MHPFKFILFIFFAFILSGCSGDIPVKTLHHQNQSDAIHYINSLNPTVIHKNKTLSFAAFIKAIQNQQAIFVGENHDRYDNHLNQLAILKALHQHNPNIGIGVEWFQQPYQWVVNRYLNGSLSEKELLRKSEYYRRWQYQYAMLRPILLYAKQHKIPVIALNASVELTRKVGKSGLASLTPQERKQLPRVIHPAKGHYREKLAAIFKHHSKDKKLLENFISVQRIWDETMAMNAAKFLNQHPKHTMIVFAGNGHISDDVAIPADLKRQLDVTTTTISSGTKKEKSQANHVDYYVINEAVSLPKAGKLGVMLTHKGKQVIISMVLKGGAAEKAGLEKDDQLQAIDGKIIQDLADFKQQLNSKQANDRVKLGILRKNQNTHTPIPLSFQLILQ